MTPEALSTFLENWITIIFVIFTGASTISSFLVKILVSFVKSQQEFLPEYRPGRALIFTLSILQAVALNSPAAATIIKKK